MKNKYKFLAIIMLILSLISIISIENDTLNMDIVGSTSVQPICEQLVKKYEKTHSNVDINVQGGGTGLGIKCANLSVAEIGMSSKEIDCENMAEYEIGREGIVIIVNKANPIKDLSTKNIRDIYSGKIKDWGEISNKSGKINVIIREDGSGTLDAFKQTIMKNNSIKKEAIVQNSAGSIKQSVIQDENAIGFVSLMHCDKTIKNISIDGVYASNNSIIDDSYKLQRPFILLTNKTPNNQTMNFIHWLESSEAKSILDSEKIICVD